MKCDDCEKGIGDGLLTPGVVQGTDGVYRWAYDLNMWTNPVIVIALIKVFLLASLVPTLLVSVLALIEDGLSNAVSAFISVGSVVGMIMLVLLAITYLLIGIINGGRYCVAFELDGKGVKHIQMQKQFKCSQVLSMITALAGALTGSPTVAGAGLLAGAKRISYSQFSKVQSLTARHGLNVIYINEAFERNQVYVCAEDFDAVFNYICIYCKKARIVKD